MKCKCAHWLILLTGFLNGAVLYADAVTVRLTPMPLVTTTATSTYRGRDVANNPYAADFFAPDFSGYTDRMVTVTYQTTGGTFRGRLVARGLKPNFAYQVKLVGKPTKSFGADGDDETNERLGFTGRWWFKQVNDTDDETYRRRKDEPDFLAQGYLIFDQFVTDRFGNAVVDFAAAHSGHVLWRIGNPSLPGSGVPKPKDPAPFYRRVLAQKATGYGYAADYPSQRIGVWIEIERKTAGATVMPLGDYHCRLLLTEESFHESGPGAGFWASALGAEEVRFRITEPTPPTITGPKDGQVLTGPVVIKGTAEPWEVVRLLEGEIVVGEARTDETGRWWLCLPRLAPGAHTLQAVAVCGARSSLPGAAVTFTE
jgi:hypothetical protein